MASYIQQIQSLNTHSPSMFVQTFGCQMNERESEKLRGVLISMGYTEAESEETADLVLYNTCCVRESAENRVFGKLGYLKAQKAKNPQKTLVFCGCMPQRPEVLDIINKQHRHLDVIFGTFNKHRFPQLLLKHLQTRKQVIEILQEHVDDEDYNESGNYEADENLTTRVFAHKAGVSIMYGCNNFCSYCIVPHVRGREKSRPEEEIIAEITALAKDGVKEVMLLGQNVNSYAYGFADLLRRVNKVEGLKRIRFMTSHPKDLSDDLINAMRECEKVTNHIHLPMQAGSSTVLKAMNRGYTKEEYLGLVARLRQALPGIAITTDIIVAFPGETEEDFLHTLDAVKQAQFSGAYTFLYSHRKGTPAAEMDMVPVHIAKERFNKLAEVLKPIQLAFNEKHLNEVVEIIAEGESTGRTEGNMLVHFDEGTGKVTPGDILSVKITECKTFYVKGSVV